MTPLQVLGEVVRSQLQHQLIRLAEPLPASVEVQCVGARLAEIARINRAN
jgi:hypothetical protein